MSDQPPNFSFSINFWPASNVVTQGLGIDTLAPLPDQPSAIRLFLCQVWRNGNWQKVDIQQANGQWALKKAGHYVLDVVDDGGPTAVLYEGDKIRIYRGTSAAPMVRVFTGYIDMKLGTKKAKDGTRIRTYTAVDQRKDLKDAITLRGQVFDGFEYGIVLSKLMIGAMDTNQLVWTDDAGVQATTDLLSPGISPANNASEIPNFRPYWGLVDVNPPIPGSSTPVAYFPALYNDDTTRFCLPVGSTAWIPQTWNVGQFGIAGLPASTAASGTAPSTGVQQNGWFKVPTLASGQGAAYLAFELPKQYILASTFSIGGTWKVANAKDNNGFWTASFAVPPPVGSVSVDWYNGVMYFNDADQGKDVFLSYAYWEQPLFDVPFGISVADAIDEITSKIGMEFLVDPNGKFYTVNKDIVRPPARIYTDSIIVNDLGVTIDRDRRNVLICLGWDPAGMEIVGAKCVNADDWINPPPLGLGKRAYMILQDKSWRTQEVVDRAAYYAAQQAFRRAKISTFSTQGDPSLHLENAIMFRTDLPEISPNDIYYISTIDAKDTVSGGKVSSIDTISCQSIAGRGMFHVQPTIGGISSGYFDYRGDTTGFVVTDSNGLPGTHLMLTVGGAGPAGGTATSTFSISANNLGLLYDVEQPAGEILGKHPPNGPAILPGTGAPLVTILIVGSDGYYKAYYFNTTFGGGPRTQALDTAGMTVGAAYMVKATFFDPISGLRVYYRDFIFATA